MLLSVILLSPAAGQQCIKAQGSSPVTAPQPLPVLCSSAFPEKSRAFFFGFPLQSQPRMKSTNLFFLFLDRIFETTAASGAVHSAAPQSLEMLQKEHAPGLQNAFLPYANACSCQGCTGDWSSLCPQLASVSQGCSQHFHKEKAARNCKGLIVHGTFGINLCLWEDSCTHNKVLES